MTITRYGVCPRCGTIVSKREVTATAGTVESIDYVKGEKCRTACKGRRANQAPEIRREKR
jgi:hypothetical protein